MRETEQRENQNGSSYNMENADTGHSQNSGYYAAIDLGTNSCRLVVAQPTPSSFHVVDDCYICEACFQKKYGSIEF